MNDQRALTVYDQFDELQRAALALYKSGYFKDIGSEAQAVVKVMAGAELGLPPFASVAGIHIIGGKPVLGANVLATLVKNDPRYDYKVMTATNDVCTLVWYENGEKSGVSEFTIDEAKNIPAWENDKKITLDQKGTWKSYPSDMLFARAISRGARRYAPGIFGGSPVYTPDEMGAEVDEEGKVVIDTNFKETEPERIPDDWVPEHPLFHETEPKPEPEKELINPDLVTLENLPNKLLEWAGNYEGTTATQRHRNLLAGVLETTLEGDNPTRDRYTLTIHLTGYKSTKEIPDALCLSMLKTWLGVTNWDTPPSQVAIEQARALLPIAKKEVAILQPDMFEDETNG